MSRDHLEAGPGCRVPVDEVTWRFTASGGPGGQHANRNQTAAEATLDLRTARGIEPSTRDRLVARLGPTMRVRVDRTRSQHQNRELALDELTRRLEEAQRRPRRRRPTKPTRSARRRRVDDKRRRGQTKKLRGRPAADD